MRKKVFAFTVVLLALALIAIGCGSSSGGSSSGSSTSNNQQTGQQPSNQQANQGASAEQPKAEDKPAGPPAKVLLGMNPTLTSNSSFYIALEKGFFAEQNLDVEVKPFENANAVNVAIASGSVDVGGTGITADMYNMIAAGQKIIIAADKGREEKGYHFSAVIVPSDSPVNSIEELKGKRAGVSTIGSTLHYNLARILENHGLSTNDVQWVPMNATRNVIEAIRGKNLDVAVFNEPNVSQALTEGYGKVLAYVSDEIDFQSSAVFFSPQFAANKDVAVRFLKGYLKGARYYYDAVLQMKDGQLVPGENYDEVVQIVAKYTKQDEEVIKKSFSYIDPNGQPKVENIQEQIDWYFKENLITDRLNAEDIVNLEFLEEALKGVN